MLEYTGERYLPWLDQPQAAYEHLHRYVFAAGLAGGKRVLDLASGEGYGSALLARSAAAVVGIDLDGEAVAHARRRYPQDNLSFLQGSIEAVPLQASAAFDLVVCFEAIEHVQEPEAVVREARRLLKPDGLFLVSTPNKRTFTEETGRTWHWHTREFSLEEFRGLLSRAFPHVALLGQRVLPGSYLWPLDGSPEPAPESRDAVIRWQGDGFVPGEPEAPLFFLAVASAAPFPEGLEHRLSATRHHLVDASARLLLEKDAIQKVAEEREAYARSLEAELERTRQGAAEQEDRLRALEGELVETRRVAEERETYAKSLEAELEKVRAALEQPSGPAQGALPEPNLEGAAACTVISKNYLPQARVLVDSFLEHHPGVPFYVLLADRLDGYFDPAGERFQLVELDQLAIPEPEWFRFKYTVLEHDTAVKPYFFSYLLEQVGVRKLIYLDPDILVLGSLQEVYALLETHNAVLTPHLTAPVSDGRRPAELDILMAGTYNLGFIGLADSEVTRAFLWWWQDRCYNGCRMAVEEGMHVDQKWIDLAPAFFEGFHVLTHPGYNVAYWNLHERRISFRDGRVWVNGQPGYFFHFSGFDPDNPEQISRHQDRFRLSTLNHATRKLFERYRLLMLDAGYEECRGWPYAFDRFANGVRIPEAARRLVFTMEDEDRRRLGDPFEVTPDRETFFGWLNGRAEEDPNPEAPPVSRLWLHLYRLRRDVQEVFPDLFGAHREAFLRWAAEHGRYEHRLDAAFAPPLPPLPKPERLSLPFGVNVCGYFNSEKGVGEAGRSVVRALASAGVPHVLNNVVDPLSANVDRTYGAFSAENPFAINVVCMNADATETLLVHKGEHYLLGRHNIGVWNWELEWFPEEWRRYCEVYDEIWTPSTFTAASVSAVSPVPVFVVPYPLAPEPAPLEALDREALGLPPDAFVFLFTFDFQSFVERKNPLAVVRAFKEAFPEQTNAVLLIKTGHSDADPAALDALLDAARYRNIRILDCILSREAAYRLFDLSDCYVSLHRSEGFGLTMAEAMRAGKPVIATAYSSNLDFMTEENAYLVPYTLVEIQRNHGPYRRGAVWAEPDIHTAAELMRHVYEQREEAAAKGRRAREDILTLLHPQTVGERVRQRLLAVAQDRGVPVPPGLIPG